MYSNNIEQALREYFEALGDNEETMPGMENQIRKLILEPSGKGYAALLFLAIKQYPELPDALNLAELAKHIGQWGFALSRATANASLAGTAPAMGLDSVAKEANALLHGDGLASKVLKPLAEKAEAGQILFVKSLGEKGFYLDLHEGKVRIIY